MNCASCKNLKSDDRCPARALNGLLFCGRHAKAKQTRLWTQVHNIPEKVVKIQKVWRGYLIRNWIKESGIGCLKRSLCHNEEELVTLESKDRQYPLDYFSFEENGKIWWFDIRSMSQILTDSLHPQNPYTRTPLKLEDRVRLRELCYRRRLFKQEVLHNHSDTKITRSQYIDRLWMVICQILEENGFSSIHPDMLSSMSVYQHILLLSMFLLELKILACEHKKSGSRRHKYVVWCRRTLNGLYESDHPEIDVPKLFFAIFRDSTHPFPYCFIFGSVLYKM